MEPHMIEANEKFFDNIINVLREDGIYFWPSAGVPFTKKDGKLQGDLAASREAEKIVSKKYFKKNFVISQKDVSSQEIKKENMKATAIDSLTNHWNDIAKGVLVGKTIVAARYLSDKEANNMGWNKRPLMFTLNDGTNCLVSMDDEGNDGGSLFYGTSGVLPTL